MPRAGTVTAVAGPFHAPRTVRGALPLLFIPTPDSRIDRRLTGVGIGRRAFFYRRKRGVFARRANRLTLKRHFRRGDG